jgi:hypothetical protein
MTEGVSLRQRLAVAAGWLDRRLVLLLMAGLFILSDALSAAARKRRQIAGRCHDHEGLVHL